MNRYTCVNPGACDCGRAEGEYCRHWPEPRVSEARERARQWAEELIAAAEREPEPRPHVVVNVEVARALLTAYEELGRLRRIEEAAREAVIAYDDKLGASWRNACEDLRAALSEKGATPE